MIRSSLALLSLALLAALPAAAQDARAALIRSVELENRVSYAGRQTTVVTFRGKTRTAQQVVKRLAPNKLRIEYVAPDRLKGELVVDDGQRLRRCIPNLRVIEEGPSQVQRSLRSQARRIQALRDGKTAVVPGGESTLLNRPVTIVSLLPAKPERPTRTLWLDRATGVALRIVDRFPNGRTSDTRFVQIDFDPILGPQEFQLPVPRGFSIVPASLGRPIAPKQAQQIARRLWGEIPQPAWLPAGFALTSAHQLRFHQSPVIVFHYTRGHDDLSLFLSGSAGEPYAARVEPRVSVVQRPMGRVLVTLVSSLSPGQLQQIAASLRLPDEPGAPQPPLAARGRSR